MGYVYALLAVFLWSFNLIIASYFATSLQPFEIAFGRWLVAAIILVPLSLKSLIQNFSILRQHIWLIIALALSGIVWDNTLIYYAGRTTSAINMGLLNVTGPLFLVIMSRIFFKTPISAFQTLGMLIALGGVITVIVNGDFSSLADFKFAPGDGIMLLNTFCFAIYSLLQGKRPPQVPQSALLAATVIFGLLIIFPFMLISTGENGIRHLQPIDLAVFVYLGIFNSVIAYSAWNVALGKLGNLKTSIIYYLMPLFAGIEAYLILHEKLYAATLIGGAPIIYGIALVNFGAKNKPHQN